MQPSLDPITGGEEEIQSGKAGEQQHRKPSLRASKIFGKRCLRRSLRMHNGCA